MTLLFVNVSGVCVNMHTIVCMLLQYNFRELVFAFYIRVYLTTNCTIDPEIVADSLVCTSHFSLGVLGSYTFFLGLQSIVRLLRLLQVKLLSHLIDSTSKYFSKFKNTTGELPHNSHVTITVVHILPRKLVLLHGGSSIA